MGLTDDKRIFYLQRASCEVVVRAHAYLDYPERGFSLEEIVLLVRKGRGKISVNGSPQAIRGSSLFETTDENGNYCKLVILIEKFEVDGEESQEGIQVVVCSAYREPII